MPPNNLEGVIAQEQKLCLKSPCNQENNNALEDDEGNADGKPRNEDAVPDENEVVELGTAPCVDNVRSFVLEDQAVSVVISDGAGIIGASSHSLEDARMLSLSVVRHDDKLNGLVQSLREAWLERRPTIDDLENLQVLRNPTEFLTSLMPWTMEDDFVLSALETFVTKDSGYTWSAQIIGFFLLHSAVQKSIYPQATNFSTELPDMNKVSMTKEEDSTYLQTVGDLKSKRSKKMAEISSIASMVQTKQEEAMMFQMQEDVAMEIAVRSQRLGNGNNGNTNNGEYAEMGKAKAIPPMDHG